MHTITIKLKEELHSNHGVQPKINFELCSDHYNINGYSYPLSTTLISICADNMKGYLHNVMNNTIIVTLFFKNDILEEM